MSNDDRTIRQGKGVWLVTVGGASSAAYARVVSRHTSYDRAQARAVSERGKLFAAGDMTTRCGVEHVDTYRNGGGVA